MAIRWHVPVTCPMAGRHVVALAAIVSIWNVAAVRADPVAAGASEQQAERIARTMATGHAEFRQGAEQLAELPREDAIAGLAAVLRDGTAYSDDGLREQAYEQLVRLGGAQSEQGFAQLLAGLDDPPARRFALRGLSAVPEGKREVVVARLEALLGAGSLSESDTIEAYHALARMGRSGSRVLPVMESAVLQRDNSEQIRFAALQSVFACCLPETSWSLVDRMTDSDRHLVLWVLLRQAGKTAALESDGMVYQRRAEDFCLNALGSENPQAREAALMALLPVCRQRLENDEPVRNELVRVLDQDTVFDQRPRTAAIKEEILAFCGSVKPGK